MRQELLFNHNPTQLIDLVEINRYLTNKVSSYHEKLGSSIIKAKYLSPYEEEISLKAIQDGKTQMKLDDVEYCINPAGYREPKSIKQMHNSTGVWGCSYTFGVGVPEKDLYCSLLSEKLQTPIHNFGIPGAGIQKITKSFIVNNNFFKFKTAFFVMPSLYRFEHASFSNYDTPNEVFSDKISSFDFIPNSVPKHNKDLARKVRMFYELHDDAFFFMEFYKNLELIKQNAEINNTKLYFTTWCEASYKFCLEYKIPGFSTVQFLENNENMIHGSIQDFARDGFHPGIRSHQATANVLYDLYKGITPSKSFENKKNLKFI
jgi:hypothetical protein